MASELDECVKKVMAASMAENEAIGLDRQNDRAQAIAKYEESVREFAAAIDLSSPSHNEDRPKLIEHKAQIESRIAELKKNAATTVPVEDQIKSVQLAMAGAAGASNAVSSAGGVKTLAACAALGAVGGAIILGGTVGFAVTGAVGGAAAAGYAATRNDGIGQAARTAGGVALSGAAKAQELNEQHQITAKLADAGGKTVAKAQAINEQHQITSRASVAGGAALDKAKAIDGKYNVTGKLAGGFAKGLDGVSSLMGGKQSAASGAAAAAAPK